MRRWAMAVGVMMLAAGMAAAEDWPQFRGLNRDGISPEKGLLKTWPEGGPKVLWEFEIGEGFSSVAVVGGTVYATGFVGKDLMVTALDSKGQKIWQQKVDAAGSGGGHKGARSTPTIDGDLLYLLSEGGKLVCLRTKDGSEVWSKNILSEYRAKNTTWKLAESVLIDGDRAICTPGAKASLVAFNKKTGEEVWAAKPVVATWTERRSKEKKQGPDKTSYSSARVVEVAGMRQIINFTAHTVFGVKADDGTLLWSDPHETLYDVNATSVVSAGGVIFVTSGYGSGSEGLKLSVTDGKAAASQFWTNKDLDDHFGGVVLLDGKVYGTAFRGSLVCIDLAKGTTVYKKREIKKASNIYADGLLYCQGHNGRVQLVDPAGGRLVSSFNIPVKRKKMMWAHPAISGGRLYIHHDETLTCYDISATN